MRGRWGLWRVSLAPIRGRCAEKNKTARELWQLDSTVARDFLNKSGRRVSKTRYLFISVRKIVTFIQVLRYVFPEFLSPHGFLRARACDTLGRFEQLEFKETSNLVTVYRNIPESMADLELLVLVEAALTLQPLIRHEVNRASMQQNIPQIMQQLLKL